jgi:CRP-like cAMP-binding protein
LGRRRRAREVSAIEPLVAILQNLDICAGASRTALERLARSATAESVAAGIVVINEGTEADDFFVLTSGEVAVSATGGSGSERSLGTLSAPDYFGEIGLLEHRSRTATVTAIGSCTVLRINGSEFVDALTATTPSPLALERMRIRLARTPPPPQSSTS